MPRVPTEEEAIRARNARDWRGRADALSKAVSEFLRVDTALQMLPHNRDLLDQRAVIRFAMQTALADYLRTD